MNADDVVVLEMGIGTDEHYEIGRLVPRRDPGLMDEPFTLVIFDNDGDRTTAFDKARKAAGPDHVVFFTQYGRPGLLQAEFNPMPCPKCGMYTKGFETITFDNGAQSMRCHACKRAIEIRITEP